MLTTAPLYLFLGKLEEGSPLAEEDSEMQLKREKTVIVGPHFTLGQKFTLYSLFYINIICQNFITNYT